MQITDSVTKIEVAKTAELVDAGVCATEFLKDSPEARIKKWNGEVDVGIACPAVSGSLENLTDKVKWGSGDAHIEAYSLSPKEGMEDGGLEIEFVLNVRPSTNRFDFHIDGWEEYDWWHQPALTPEQIKSGRFRPDNVIDSYAVYHKEKRDHVQGGINYGTGKAFHIYRPKLIDANGVETWGALEFDNGILTVVIPQKALDTAAYPARVDPTFGYTGVAATAYLIGIFIEGTRGTAASAGTVDSISVYCQTSAAVNVKGVLVLQSSLNIVASGVTPASSINNGAAAWSTINYSSGPSVSASTDYYVCVIPQDVSVMTMYYDSSGAGNLEDTSNNYTTPTNPTDGTIASPERYSIYATYTASGRASKNTRSNPLGTELGWNHRVAI